MVGLFANLSDNDMEACSFLPKEKRWTRLSFREAAGKLFFVLENSCSETQMKKSSEKTWKKNKEEHGLGKDIINEIVGRNNGWITFAQNTDVYRVEIMLPKS